MKGAGIDYGKMSSLHNAGWAGDRIAEEMGLSMEEYRRALTGQLDILDRWISALARKYSYIVGMLKG